VKSRKGSSELKLVAVVTR